MRDYRVVTGGGIFSNTDHLWTLSEERRNGNKSQNDVHESILRALVSDIQGNDKRLLLCAKITGFWLSVCGAAVSGTVLSDTEFRDFFMRSL